MVASEFYHFAALETVRKEAGPVGVPFVVVVGANPLRLWVAVFADVNRAQSRPGSRTSSRDLSLLAQ